MPTTATTTLPDEDAPVLGNGVEDEVAVDRESETTNNGIIRLQIRETGQSSWDATATGFDETTVAYDTLTTQFFGLEDGEGYEVRARSETDYRTGAWTGPVSITTKFPGATGLSVTVVSETEIELTWTDNADNEDGQRVVRERRGPDGDWWPERIVDDAGPNTEAYVDNTVQPGREYRYRVRPFTEHTSAESGAETASTPALGDVAQKRVPASGWYVEIDPPAGSTPLRPTILTEPDLSRPTNGLPEIRVPVPSADRWQADALTDQPMRVWHDGVQQPIDTFEGVERRAGDGRDELVLIGTGGAELDQYVDDLVINEQDTHLAVRDVVDERTDYARNVDDPVTDTRSDVKMLGATGVDIEEIVETPAATDPYEITQFRGLHNLPVGDFQEAEGQEYQGVPVFADVEGDPGAWSGGEAVRLSDTGDYVEAELEPDYRIPGGESAVRLLVAIVGDESPALSISLNGQEVDSAQYDAVPAIAADKFDLRWSTWSLSQDALEADSFNDVRFEIAQASDADVYVDVVFTYDRRYSYTFDDTPVGGELDGPEEYPEIEVPTIPAQSVEQVIGGSLEVTADTADGLSVAISNDQGQNYTEAAGTSVSTSFDSPSQEIRGRITLGRHGERGQNGHEVSEIDLRADLEDTPVLLDKQPRGKLDDILSNWADDANAVWGLRRDPDAAPDDPSGMIVEWTLAGQRAAATSAPLFSYDGSETVEGSYDQVVVFGASQSVRGEEFVASDPGLPAGLDESWIVVASETVRSTDGSTTYSRGTDYLVNWPEGAIEILDSGSMSPDTTYQIDYDWRFRGAYPRESDLEGDVDVVEDQIPSATSVRECEQLAFGIYQRVQDPLVEVELTVASDAAEPPILAALSHPDIPFDGAFKLRDRSPSADGVTYSLGTRESVSDIFSRFRRQFSALSDRV